MTPRHIAMLCCVLCIALLAAPAHAATAPGKPLVLTLDGRPRAVVVLPAKGDREKGDLGREQQVLKILTSHLQQMTGAALPVVREDELGDVKIDAGRLAPPAGKTDAETFILLGESGLTRRLGLTSDGLGPGGIAVQTTGNAVAVFGRTGGERRAGGGDAFAVVHLLEALGCHYLWPGELGKVVPSRPTLEAPPLAVRFTPPLGQRHLRMSAEGPRNFDEGLALLGVSREEYEKGFAAATATKSEGSWALWHGLGGDMGIHGGHAGAGLRDGWNRYGKTHPEWFALQADGTRDQTGAGNRWRLCVSNPDLAACVVRETIEEINKAPDTVSVSLSPNDGGYSSFCMCEACKRLDPPDGPKVKFLRFDKVGQSKRTEFEYVSLTDRYVHYWNAVAAGVTKVHPNLLFVIDAYSRYSDPPVRARLHPNLVVRYVPGTTDGWKGWQAAGAKRIYWRPNNLNRGRDTGGLLVYAARTAETMKHLAANGMIATDMDGINYFWATCGLNYYVAAKLAWNPTLPYEALLDDYCRSGFGPAAEPVKRYFRRAEELRPTEATPWTVEGLAELRGCLAAAAKAARSDPTVRRRVAFLSAGLEHTIVTAEAYRLKAAADAGEKIDFAAAGALMDRKWQLMRTVFKDFVLAVNEPLVASSETLLRRALKWKGPGDAAKAADAKPREDDAWLYEDQTKHAR